MKICAGAWLNCVVWSERTTATWSTIVLNSGSSSDTSTPASPTFSNAYGEPSRRGVPVMKAKRSPFTSSSGMGSPLCCLSFGFGSKRSTCEGAPAMNRKITCFAFGAK